MQAEHLAEVGVEGNIHVCLGPRKGTLLIVRRRTGSNPLPGSILMSLSRVSGSWYKTEDGGEALIRVTMATFASYMLLITSTNAGRRADVVYSRYLLVRRTGPLSATCPRCSNEGASSLMTLTLCRIIYVLFRSCSVGRSASRISTVVGGYQMYYWYLSDDDFVIQLKVLESTITLHGTRQ